MPHSNLPKPLDNLHQALLNDQYLVQIPENYKDRQLRAV